MKKKIISFELNEVSLLWLNFYVKKYKFSHIRKLLSFKKITTSSEKKYIELEPWIQWPSFYYSKSLAEHGFFHLGDCSKSKYETIYDRFQSEGNSVLAFAPMNCTFIPKNNSLLVHDPWSVKGVVNGDNFINSLWSAIKFFVNENSASRLNTKYFAYIIFGILKFSRPRNYLMYIKLLFFSLFFKWARALFLDLFLFDIFFYFQSKGNYKYSSLFLNAGAHIQHHYLFDSEAYRHSNGKNYNPLSYSSIITKKLDPLYQVYSLYNHLAFDILRLEKKCSILITSGLQQQENKYPYYQFRIKNYEKFLSQFSVKYKSIEKKMSRDLYIFFNNSAELRSANRILSNFKIFNKSIFRIDISKNNNSIFLQISYQGNISNLEFVKFNGNLINLREYFLLVSIENAVHCSQGWHLNNFFKFKGKKINIKYLAKSLFNFA